MARSVLAAALAPLLFFMAPALAAAPVIAPSTPRALSDDDLAEIVDFVVGNAVFALYHEAGHMVMQRYGAVPTGVGASERAADLFAATVLLEPRSGAGDQTIIDAIDSWKLADADMFAVADPKGRPDPHALDKLRADALICDVVGADPDGFADIADTAGLDPEARRACGARWQRERAAWTAAMKAVPPAGPTPSPLAVAYDEADDADAAAATILRDNAVLEEVGDRLAAEFAFADPPALRATQCGEATSRYDRAANELVLCYERATAHQHQIMRDIERRG